MTTEPKISLLSTNFRLIREITKYFDDYETKFLGAVLKISEVRRFPFQYLLYSF